MDENKMVLKEFNNCTGPYLSDWRFVSSSRLANPDIFTTNCYGMLDQLFDKLKIFKSMSEYSDEEQYLFYFRLPKGIAEQYMDYSDFKEIYEVKSKKEYYRLFNKWFPRKWYWFSAFFCRSVLEDGTYYQIYIAGGNYIYAYNGSSEWRNKGHYPEDYSMLIKPLFSWVDALIEMASKDGYKDFITKHMDYRIRNGKILYKEYWELYPKEKARYHAIFKGVDVAEFTKHFKDGEISKDAATRFPQLTANKYCELFKIASTATGRCYDDSLSLQENFHRNSDGRNKDLDNISPDSPEEFDGWYKENKHHFDHAFEMRSRYGRIDLYVEMDSKGYYLLINGRDMYESAEIMRIYLALYHYGVKTYIYDPENHINHYLGNHYRSVDDKESVLGMRFPKTKIKQFIAKVEWQEPNIIEKKTK